MQLPAQIYGHLLGSYSLPFSFLTHLGCMLDLLMSLPAFRIVCEFDILQLLRTEWQSNLSLTAAQASLQPDPGGLGELQPLHLAEIAELETRLGAAHASLLPRLCIVCLSAPDFFQAAVHC